MSRVPCFCAIIKSSVPLYADPTLCQTEKARLQAEAKAAEDARKQAEAEAATEVRRKRELEREAARRALMQVNKQCLCF